MPRLNLAKHNIISTVNTNDMMTSESFCSGYPHVLYKDYHGLLVVLISRSANEYNRREGLLG